jgi:tetratricopeptide (TPR) repeat protein
MAQTQVNLGNMCGRRKKPAEAEDNLRQALANFKDLAERHHDVLQYRLDEAIACMNLGRMRLEAGRLDAAADFFGQEADLLCSLDLGYPRVLELHMDVTGHYGQLADGYAKQGRPERVAALSGPVLALRKHLAGAEPKGTDLAFECAGACGNLGLFLTNLGRPAEARASFLDAVRLFRVVLAKQPNHTLARQFLASTYIRLAELAKANSETGQGADKEKFYLLAAALREALVADNPREAAYQSALGYVQNNLAVLYYNAGKFEQAAAWHRKALNVRERLAKEHAGVEAYQADVAQSHYNLANTYQKLKKEEEAGASFQRAYRIQDKLVAARPKVDRYLTDLQRTSHQMGLLYARGNQVGPALAAFERELEMRGRLSEAHPAGMTSRVEGVRTMGQAEHAVGAYRGDLAALEQLNARQPGSPVILILCGVARHDIGQVLHGMGKHEASAAEFDRAVGLLDTALRRANAARWRPMAETWMCTSHAGRAHALYHLKRYAESAAAYDKALALATPTQRRQWLPEYACILGRTGAHAGAAAAAEEVAALKSAAAMALYDAACALSLASAAAGKDRGLPAARQKQLAEKYAARAVVVLNQAKAAGVFKNPSQVTHMKQDSDLDAIRKRPDYGRLVADLEQVAKTGVK